jgi:DNA-binding CsgD family transcriptional regulator
MVDMAKTISRQFRRSRQQRADYGRKIELIDRRREVWKLRARGLSLRAIAQQLGMNFHAVWRDLKAAQDEWGEISESPEVLRQQLLETHRAILGGLLTAFDRELQQGGQSTENFDADGNLISRQVKSSPNVMLAAEASRTVMRAAQLMGLIQTGPDAEANAQGAQQTNIVLIAPAADGAQFELRAEQLKAEAIDVTVAAQQLPEETRPPAPEPPPEPIAAQLPSEGPTAAPEPRRRSMRTAADRAAAKAARRAAVGG